MFFGIQSQKNENGGICPDDLEFDGIFGHLYERQRFSAANFNVQKKCCKMLQNAIFLQINAENRRAKNNHKVVYLFFG